MGKLWVVGLGWFFFLQSGLYCVIFSIILHNIFLFCYAIWLFNSDPSITTLISHFYSSNSPRKLGAQCDLHVMEVAERS